MNKNEINKIICRIDSKNQSLVMKDQISKRDYELNRGYIHELYDCVNDVFGQHPINNLILDMLTNNVINDNVAKELMECV